MDNLLLVLESMPSCSPNSIGSCGIIAIIAFAIPAKVHLPVKRIVYIRTLKLTILS